MPLFERLDARVCTSFDLFVREFAEPPLRHVEPRARSRGEVQVKARVAQQPPLDLGRPGRCQHVSLRTAHIAIEFGS